MPRDPHQQQRRLSQPIGTTESRARIGIPAAAFRDPPACGPFYMTVGTNNAYCETFIKAGNVIEFAALLVQTFQDLLVACIMSSQKFYLLGEAASSAKTIVVDTKSSVDQLKNLIAAHFAIVEPNGELLFLVQMR